MCIYNVKDKFPFFIVPDAFGYSHSKVLDGRNSICCQSGPESNFSKDFPVESNIVGYNLLKTEIGSTCICVNFTSPTLGPILLPFCLLVPCILWCRHISFVSVACCVLLLFWCLWPNMLCGWWESHT